MVLYSFIGIAINIWRATRGTGGGIIPNGAIVQRNGDFVVDRFSDYVINIR